MLCLGFHTGTLEQVLQLTMPLEALSMLLEFYDYNNLNNINDMIGVLCYTRVANLTQD